MNGLQLYQGIVESRFDPLAMGRCKVRVYGVHTMDPAILSTEDLPWAYPVMPVSSASISGVGTAPVGPVEGTVCIVYFTDENQQLPIMLGTVGGVPQAPGQNSPVPVLNLDDTITLPDDAPLVPGEGAADPSLVPPGATWTEEDARRVEELRAFNEDLGGGGADAQLTPEELEYARWKGYASVPAGREEYYRNLGDPRIYGSASGAGGLNTTADGTAAPSNVEDARVGAPETTSGTTPAATGAETAPPSGADTDAEQFNLTDARPASSFRLSPRGVAFIAQQEGFSATAYWDYAQYSIGHGTGNWYGRPVTRTFPGTITRTQAAGALNDFIEREFVPTVRNAVRVLITQDMFDAMVSLCYNIGSGGFRGSSVVRYINQGDYEAAASSFALWNKAGGQVNQGLVNRRRAETALFLGAGIPDGTGELRPANDIPPVGEATGAGGSSGGNADRVTYPRYYNEPDVSRLARGQRVERTSVYAREAARWEEIPMPRVGAQEMVTDTVDTPAGPQQVEREADPATWSQVESPYNAQYPFNHVTQSQTGHTIELDDSPDAERVAIYHRRGSGVEIDHNGTANYRTVGDRYDMSERHSYVAVGGNNTVYIGGNWNVRVDNGSNIHIVGDTNITCDNDVNLYVAGDVNGNVKGDMAMNVDGNANLYTKSNLYATAEVKADIYSKGNTVLTSESDTIVKTQGNITASARGNLTANINGDATATVGGQMTQSVNGTLAIKAEKILMESRSTIDILGQSTVKVHSSSSNTEVQMGASASGVEQHSNLSDLTPVPEREDNPHEEVDPVTPDIPELTVNSRRSTYAEQFETPEEGPTESFRDAMVANGIYDQQGLDNGVEAGSDAPTINPELLTPVENCGVIQQMSTAQLRNPNLSLSPNFTLGAMTKNMSRPPVPQFGLSPNDIVCNLKNICVHVAEFVKEKYPNMTINSAFRRPGDVRASSRTSQHYLGQALDFGFSGFSRQQFYDAAVDLIKTLPYGFDQLIMEYSSGGGAWIHISFKAQGNRLNYFTMQDHRRYGENGRIYHLDRGGRPVASEAGIEREARVSAPDSQPTSPVDEVLASGQPSTAVQNGATEATSSNGVGLRISEQEFDALSPAERRSLLERTTGTEEYNRIAERDARNDIPEPTERPQAPPARPVINDINSSWSSQAQVVAGDFYRLYGENWRETLYANGNLNDDNIEAYLESRYRTN